MKRQLSLALPAAALLLGTHAACQPAHICVSDAFMMRGGESVLLARVEHRRLGDVHGLSGVPVRFFVGEAEVGAAETDAMGEARLLRRLPDDVQEFRAEAALARQAVAAVGRVFNWSCDRTALVCDVDETVSLTDYGALLSRMLDDDGSQPYPGAADTLQRLAREYDIVFLTGRPAALHSKTRRWLQRHGFPDAPLITTPNLADVLLVRRFKAAAIAELQRTIPTLAIGIGNAPTDAAAYGERSLLTVMVDVHGEPGADAERHRFAPHAVVVRDWRMLADFFESNAAALRDPERVRAVVQGERMLLRPVLAYRTRPAAGG